MCGIEFANFFFVSFFNYEKRKLNLTLTFAVEKKMKAVEVKTKQKKR